MLEFNITTAGKPEKLKETTGDYSQFKDYYSHYFEVNTEDQALVQKKIEQNHAFFEAAAKLGIKTMLIHSLFVPTKLHDINFYWGAFLYSDLNEAIKNVEKQLSNKGSHILPFFNPIFTGEAATYGNLSLTHSPSKHRNVIDSNWRRYFPEGAEPFIFGEN